MGKIIANTGSPVDVKIVGSLGSPVWEIGSYGPHQPGFTIIVDSNGSVIDDFTGASGSQYITAGSIFVTNEFTFDNGSLLTKTEVIDSYIGSRYVTNFPTDYPYVSGSEILSDIRDDTAQFNFQGGSLIIAATFDDEFITLSAGSAIIGSVIIGDGGDSITIDGTVAATQNGEWNIGSILYKFPTGDNIIGSIVIDGDVGVDINTGANIIGSTFVFNTVNVAALPTGTNNIGSVDIESSLPIGTNMIGSVYSIGAFSLESLETVGSILYELPTGTNNIGSVDIEAALPIGANILGSVFVFNTVTIDELPTGTNNIGSVDIETLPPIPAGTNNIGDVDVLTLPATPAGTNKIGSVSIDDFPSIPTGTNNIGSVDIEVLPPIPTGTNNVGSVDVETLPTIPAGENIIGSVNIDFNEYTSATANITVDATLISGTVGSDTYINHITVINNDNVDGTFKLEDPGGDGNILDKTYVPAYGGQFSVNFPGKGLKQVTTGSNITFDMTTSNDWTYIVLYHKE